MATLKLNPTSAMGSSWADVNNIFDGSTTTLGSIKVKNSNYSSRALTVVFDITSIPKNVIINSATLNINSKASANSTLTIYADVNGNASNRVINALQTTTQTTYTADISSLISSLNNILLTGYTTNTRDVTLSIYEIWIEIDYISSSDEVIELKNIKLGNSTIQDIFLGDNKITKAYLGNNLIFNNVNFISSLIPFEVTNYYLEESKKYFNTTSKQKSILFPVKQGKSYRIKASSFEGNKFLLTFLDSNMNVLTYPYYMDFILALGYYDTVPAPPNASYIIAEFATEITSTVLDTIEVTETTITPNLYNENDPSMQTHWWVERNDGVLKKDYYPTSYSVIVPVEEDKRYYMSYSFVGNRANGAYYWAFTDSEYNQIPMSPMGWESPYERLEEGYGWVSSWNYCLVTQTVPKNASYIVLYVCSTGLSESTNIVIREATDWEF